MGDLPKGKGKTGIRFRLSGSVKNRWMGDTHQESWRRLVFESVKGILLIGRGLPVCCGFLVRFSVFPGFHLSTLENGIEIISPPYPGNPGLKRTSFPFANGFNEPAGPQGGKWFLDDQPDGFNGHPPPVNSGEKFPAEPIKGKEIIGRGHQAPGPLAGPVVGVPQKEGDSVGQQVSQLQLKGKPVGGMHDSTHNGLVVDNIFGEDGLGEQRGDLDRFRFEAHPSYHGVQPVSLWAETPEKSTSVQLLELTDLLDAVFFQPGAGGPGKGRQEGAG
jgi:hypothetical protein